MYCHDNTKLLKFTRLSFSYKFTNLLTGKLNCNPLMTWVRSPRSLLTPLGPHEGVSGSWFNHSWWLNAYHHAQAAGLHYKDCKCSIDVTSGLSLRCVIPIKGKRGHGVGFPGLHWQCCCLLFTTLQLTSAVNGNFGKSSTGYSRLHFEEMTIKTEDTENMITQCSI